MGRFFHLWTALAVLVGLCILVKGETDQAGGEFLKELDDLRDGTREEEILRLNDVDDDTAEGDVETADLELVEDEDEDEDEATGIDRSGYALQETAEADRFAYPLRFKLGRSRRSWGRRRRWVRRRRRWVRRRRWIRRRRWGRRRRWARRRRWRHRRRWVRRRRWARRRHWRRRWGRRERRPPLVRSSFSRSKPVAAQTAAPTTPPTLNIVLRPTTPPIPLGKIVVGHTRRGRRSSRARARSPQHRKQGHQTHTRRRRRRRRG